MREEIAISNPCQEITMIEMIKNNNNSIDLNALNDYFYTMLAERAITFKEKRGIAPNIAIIGTYIIIQESRNSFAINSLEHQIFVREALKTLDARLYFKSIIDALTINNNANDNSQIKDI